MRKHCGSPRPRSLRPSPNWITERVQLHCHNGIRSQNPIWYGFLGPNSILAFSLNPPGYLGTQSAQTPAAVLTASCHILSVHTTGCGGFLLFKLYGQSSQVLNLVCWLRGAVCSAGNNVQRATFLSGRARTPSTKGRLLLEVCWQAAQSSKAQVKKLLQFFFVMEVRCRRSHPSQEAPSRNPARPRQSF